MSGRPYTAADVKSILVAFANEHLVDVPAVHNKDGYWLEYTELSGFLILGEDEYFEQVAETANTGDYE